MTDKEAMKLALDALEACHIYGELECVMTPDSAIYLHPAITAIKEALAEHAMREVQRLGQEIEQEPSSVQQAYAMAQVCLDLHDAIGCKWGDNVYFAIDQLKAAAHTPQRTEPLIGCVNHDCALCKEKNT
jgi:hypothetical protein